LFKNGYPNTRKIKMDKEKFNNLKNIPKNPSKKHFKIPFFQIPRHHPSQSHNPSLAGPPSKFGIRKNLKIFKLNFHCSFSGSMGVAHFD
jgi:hypothetical protein